MIKVIIISSKAKTELALLDWHADIDVSVVTPTSLDQTLQQTLTVKPNIILIEQTISSFSADLLCHLLFQHMPSAQSIILTNKAPTFEMLQNTGFSARGYLTNEQRSSLAKAVRVVHEGEAWLPRKIVTEMLNRFAENSLPLSDRSLQLVK